MIMTRLRVQADLSFSMAADFTHAVLRRTRHGSALPPSEHASTQARLVRGLLSLAASDVPCSQPVSGSRNLPGTPHKPSFYNILGKGGSNPGGDQPNHK